MKKKRSAPLPNHIFSSLVIVKEMLRAIGEDPDREGLKDTPRRVVKAWDELFSGYKSDPNKVLSTTFGAEDYDSMVICKDIEMFSTCEHHLLPFYGRVHIGYIPRRRVVGLSKLARLVEVFSRRLQIQERMTQQIAEAIHRELQPKGVMVVVSARHLCMAARGVGKQSSEMVTSAIRGVFTETESRAEFLELIK